MDVRLFYIKDGKCYAFKMDLASTHVFVHRQQPLLLVGDQYFAPLKLARHGDCLPVNTSLPIQAFCCHFV